MRRAHSLLEGALGGGEAQRFKEGTPIFMRGFMEEEGNTTWGEALVRN
jgi:hypothetical protein